jgi:2-amino-4-hydroxy-6-hydroxymethyldihydropteridine diphosphokinase
LILIALGANLPSRYGKPEETLEAAKAELERRGVAVVKASRTVTTAPVPVSSQPDYRNAVIEVETKLAPRELHRLLKAIEKDFGREEGERNAARILDLDLLAYGRKIATAPMLQLPHPRMHQRAFVLEPLCEIAPQWVHPVLKQTAQQLFHSLPENVSCETEVA